MDFNLQFEQVYMTARYHIIPYIERWAPDWRWHGARVLDVGFGEGGVAKAFAEKGAKVVGVELEEGRLQRATTRLQQYIVSGQVLLKITDIYLMEGNAQFDLIILKDVIEHVPNQQQFVSHLSGFLRKGGYLWIGFPPWFMPFGGHQQIIKKPAWLSWLPYFHLLPTFLFRRILTSAGVAHNTISHLIEIKQTGISTRKLEKICRKAGLEIVNRTFFITNPVYKYRFGLPVIAVPRLLASLPWWLRDLFTTCAYYLFRRI